MYFVLIENFKTNETTRYNFETRFSAENFISSLSYDNDTEISIGFGNCSMYIEDYYCR